MVFGSYVALGQMLLFATINPESHRPEDPSHRAGEGAELGSDVLSQRADLSITHNKPL